MDKPIILVADDEPDLLASMQFNLEAEGYGVITATDGAEALEVARRELPDLVVMDVMMPVENGYRVARTLSEDYEAGKFPRRIPVILVTARNLASDRERETMFMEFSRADAVVYKPFVMEDLVDRIRNLLTRPEATCERGRR